MCFFCVLNLARVFKWVFSIKQGVLVEFKDGLGHLCAVRMAKKLYTFFS